MGIPATPVTKTGGCPICGHPDWCYWLPYENRETGYECQILVCNRTSDGENTIGHDGCQYVFKWKSKTSGACVYMRREDDEGNREAWLEKNGRKKAGRKENTRVFKPAAVVPTVREERKIEALPNDRIGEINDVLFRLLNLDPKHAAHYLKQGWTEEMLQESSIRTVPQDWHPVVERLERKFGKDCLLGYPGAYQTAGGNWSILARSGILVPVYDLNGNIFRLRNRRDFLDAAREMKLNERGEGIYTAVSPVPRIANGKDLGFKMDQGGTVIMENVKHVVVPMKGVFLEVADEVTHRKVRVKDKASMKGGKYIWVSASEKTNPNGTRTYINGCSTGSEPGLFTKPKDNMSMCFLIEGELKCMVVNHKLGMPAISLPGVGNWETAFQKGYINALKERGTCMFVVGFDADKATNEAVLKFEQALVNALKKDGNPTAIVSWDPECGKGIDDAILSGGQLLYNQV